MDWLLTVPLLLIEIVFVMELKPEETSKKAWQLGASAALMIILGYPGELILEADKLSTRWVYWALAMIPFLFVVYTLLVGLADNVVVEERGVNSEDIVSESELPPENATESPQSTARSILKMVNNVLHSLDPFLMEIVKIIK